MTDVTTGPIPETTSSIPVFRLLPHGLLQNKVAVVTGASRGIGRAVCDLFAANGAVVFACVRQLTPGLLDWQAQWAAQGVTLQIITLDLCDDTSQKNAVKQIRGSGFSPTILVNCAGIASGATFALTAQANIREIFESNLFMQLSWCQLMARLLTRSPSSSIINLSSSAAREIDPGTMAYGVSKAALERMSLSMAVELAAQGVRVNVIAPGVTNTDMASQMDSSARDALIARQLLKKPAQPVDIANTALFLGSDLATHITGQVIRVDGGLI